VSETPNRFNKIIDRLLRALPEEDRTGLGLAGFTFEAPDDGAIRDGEYGDPDRSTRPEWMKAQERGWQSPKR
jgi:hypothetical protein